MPPDKPDLSLTAWLFVLAVTQASAQTPEPGIEERLRADPGNAKLWFELSDSVPPEAALEAWRRLPKALQESAEGWRAGARLGDRVGDYPLGVRAAGALIELAAGRGDAAQESREWEQLGLRHARFGATEAAREALRQAKVRALQAGRKVSGIDRQLASLESEPDNVPPEPELAARLTSLRTQKDQGPRAAHKLRGLALQCWHVGAWQLGLDAYRHVLSMSAPGRTPAPSSADDLNGAARMALEVAIRSSGDARSVLLEEAKAWATRAIDLHRAMSRETEMLLRDHCVLAGIHSALGHREEALHHFEEEFRLVLAQRKHLEGEESVRVFHAERDHVFEDFALALAAAGSQAELERALRVSEIGRLGALREVQRFRGRPGLSWTEEALAIAPLQRQAAACGAVILVFLAGSFECGLVAITADAVRFHSLGRLEPLDRVAKEFSRRALDLESSPEAIHRAGWSAVEVFLAPVRDAISIHRRVILVGAGRWTRLPFAALPWKSSEGGWLVPLANASEVVHTPCLTSLLVPQSPSPSARTVLAFGHSGVASVEERLRVHFGAALLPPLRRTALEARLVADAFEGGRCLVEAEATEASWRSLAPSADLIHVAAHAVVDDRERTRSVLLLQPDLPADDGLLSLPELGAVPLAARLVVLSCCRTAIGRELAGEGVRGLARAILSAGADSVVVSRSAVDDQMAPIFLRHLFGEIRAGLSLPAAFAAAQRAMLARRQTSHPALWSTFLMIGQGEMLRN